MASHIIYQDSYLYCAHAQSLQPNPQTANTSIYEAMAIYYNILGHKRVLIEGSIYTLRPGELFILNESEAFIVYEDAEEPSEYLQLVFSRYVFRHLDPDFSLLSRFTHRALGESNVIRLDDRQNALFSACLKHIEQNRNRPDLRISFLGILMIFINEINISNWYCAPSTDSDGQKIIAYINENLQVNLTNESVARHFYMSESQFCRYFKRLTGTTLTNYVNKNALILHATCSATTSKSRMSSPYAAFMTTQHSISTILNTTKCLQAATIHAKITIRFCCMGCIRLINISARSITFHHALLLCKRKTARYCQMAVTRGFLIRLFLLQPDRPISIMICSAAMMQVPLHFQFPKCAAHPSKNFRTHI